MSMDDVIELLINAGANTKAVNKTGEIPKDLYPHNADKSSTLVADTVADAGADTGADTGADAVTDIDNSTVNLIAALKQLIAQYN